MNNTITISLPEGWELANEKKQRPHAGDNILVFNSDGYCHIDTVEVEPTPGRDYGTFYIVRKAWKPPASCPKGTIFKQIPTKLNNSPADANWYLVKNGCLYDVTVYSDFTPPPYSPYVVE